MIRKIIYGFLMLFLLLFIGFWTIKITGNPKPISGTKEYLKLHGYVEGKVNEIRVGNVLLRFPAGVDFSPHTTGKIMKGVADSVTVRIYYNNDETNSNGIRVDINKYGVEDPATWDQQYKKENWKEVVARKDLGLIEYRRNISGGWGGVTYVTSSSEDRTPKGSLIAFLCSDIKGDLVECKSDFIAKNGLAISYFFMGNEIKHWRSIHNEVVNFIDSIIVQE